MNLNCLKEWNIVPTGKEQYKTVKLLKSKKSSTLLLLTHTLQLLRKAKCKHKFKENKNPKNQIGKRTLKLQLK